MACLSVFGRAHTQCVQCAPKKARTLARQYQFEQGRRLAAQICGARVGTLKSENHVPVPEVPGPATLHYSMRSRDLAAKT